MPVLHMTAVLKLYHDALYSTRCQGAFRHWHDVLRHALAEAAGETGAGPLPAYVPTTAVEEVLSCPVLSYPTLSYPILTPNAQQQKQTDNGSRPMKRVQRFSPDQGEGEATPEEVLGVFEAFRRR